MQHTKAGCGNFCRPSPARHLREALPNVASGDYMGEHWLASFAVYALTMQPSVID